MNELQLIRQQLATERAHLAASAQACADALGGTNAPAAALGPFRQACVDYLRQVLERYRQRDARVALLSAALGAADPRCNAVQQILARSGSSPEALAKLAAADATELSWREFAQFLDGPWAARRDALELLLGNDSRLCDWRLISGIDADGILQERALFARVTALLPAGVTPGSPGTRAA